ncbi:telokin-like protein [Alphabaculovirus altersperidaniae]|uniref:Telokin-like protein n=1 Tax=Spodoptera eridania nucleopolyhedrovirus TaxID=2315721 RepID=A0ABX6TQ85_9ABAC|nr:telokin-like protein [Spodoptera eridania nucleopolyhedrovirus]QNV47815.1 telokin-like protein [Spodoptera eridania nucleopolyhedrovirus]
MATSNSGTIDISVHVTLDKESKRNVLSFIVREEYHLKKLAVGAYNINILDTQLLNSLSKHRCNTIACGDYVIVYNFVDNSNKINVILFNIKPTILKKGNCIFKIVYDDAVAHVGAAAPIATITTDKMMLDDEPVQHQEQHVNSQLFKSAFGSHSDDDDDSSSSDDESSDGDNNAGAGAHQKTKSTDKLSSAVPAKRQKLDDSVEGQV